MRIKLQIIKEAFPGKGQGMIFCDNDDYTILINSKLSEDEQAAAFLHEALHIWHDDFNSGRSADSIEETRKAELHRLIELMNK